MGVMKAKRAWLIAIALVGYLVLDQYQSRRDQVAALRSEIAGLHKQQERLAIEVARPALVVRTQIAAAAESSATAPSPAAQAATAGPSGHDADDLTTRDRRWEDDARASLASIEAAFAAEPINDGWATSTRLALHDRLTALSQASSSSLRDIDCRSSICRVEVVHRDIDASRQFTQKAFADQEQQAWNGPAFMLPQQSNPDGSLAVVMYLGREGTSLLKR